MMKEIIKNIWIKSIDFVYHSYIYNSGWLGIIGSFSSVYLLFKYGSSANTSTNILENATNTSDSVVRSSINKFIPDGNSFITERINGLLEVLKNILEPITVSYSNEVLCNQINSLAILLFILSIIIFIVLLGFLINILIFIYSDKLLKYFTNKYITKLINFNKQILKLEITFVGFILLYFMYHICLGLHFIAVHPVIFK